MNILPDLYNKTNRVQRKDAQLLVSMIYEEWKNRKPGVIVDVGCGTGNLTWDLLGSFEGSQIIGIDKSSEMIEFATKRDHIGKARFECGDIGISWSEFHKQTGIVEEAADLVFSNYCLHWVENKLNALKNIVKMLKPGGQFYATVLLWSEGALLEKTFLRASKWSNHVNDNVGPCFHGMQETRPNMEETIGYWEKLSKAAGFNEVTVGFHKLRGVQYENFEGLKATLIIFLHYVNYIPQEFHEDYRREYFDFMQAFYNNEVKKREFKSTEYISLTLRAKK